jgi:hypothetical protein
MEFTLHYCGIVIVYSATDHRIKTGFEFDASILTALKFGASILTALKFDASILTALRGDLSCQGSAACSTCPVAPEGSCSTQIIQHLLQSMDHKIVL